MDFSYWFFGAFVDHDPTPGVLDYNCMGDTYDGHLGTDIGLYPFKWNMMAEEMVDVVAAADGTIVELSDGNFDMNCFGPEDDPGPRVKPNRVKLSHVDGMYTTLYSHMKQGSIPFVQADVEQGTMVKKGDRLGSIGSSGKSSGPHLHFEVRTADNTVVDPFYLDNGCGEPNDESLWEVQPLYYDPRVFKLMTSAMQVEGDMACGELAVTHEDDEFCPGDGIYVYRFYGDISQGESAEVDVFDPNAESIYHSVDQPKPEDPPVSRTLRRRNDDPLVLPDIQGTWKVKVTFAGKPYEHPFKVTDGACPPPPCASDDECPMGQVCSAGTCLTGECADDADCPRGQTCDLETLTCMMTPSGTTGEGESTGAGTTEAGDTAAATTETGLEWTTTTTPPTSSGSSSSPGGDPHDPHTSGSGDAGSSTGETPAGDADVSEGCSCASQRPLSPVLVCLPVLLGRRGRRRRRAR
jgi:Cys-rich repeat protein